MRKELRRAGGRAETLVRNVEEEMMDWLQGGVILRPDESNAADLQHKSGEGREIGTTGSILEVSRTPLQLVWSVADDAFARYVVHCCARYHEVVSFSQYNRACINVMRLTTVRYRQRRFEPTLDLSSSSQCQAA
jgi:hypothetical protein